MTVTIKVCTTIPVPISRCWEVLEPIETHTQWMADAESIEFRSAQTRGTGTSFTCVTRVGPFRLDDEMTITRWEPPQVMGVEHRGLVTGSGVFRLVPARHDTTRICWEEELRFPWWMGGWFAERAGRPVLSRIWRANLRRLRHLACAGAEMGRAP